MQINIGPAFISRATPTRLKGRLNKQNELVFPGFAAIAPTEQVNRLAETLASRASLGFMKMLRSSSEEVLRHQDRLTFDVVSTHLVQLHAILLARRVVS